MIREGEQTYDLLDHGWGLARIRATKGTIVWQSSVGRNRWSCNGMFGMMALAEDVAGCDSARADLDLCE